MATDVERLVVSLEASITKYERAMQRAVGQTNATARKIESRFKNMSGVADNAFGKIATAYASAQALRGAVALADANTRIENSLKVAGLAGEDLTRVYDSLFASAQRNAAPLEALATLYGRAASAQKELGASSADLARFTENVAMALRVQGGDASQAQGALLQLGQALGSARVFAEEFNSINEGARPILQAAAAGIEEAGGSVAKLKQLVIEGKVSNKAFFDGIQAGSYVLENQLVNAELTVAQAFVRLQNVLVDVAGKFNEGTGAGQEFVAFLQVLGERITIAGDNFDKGVTPVQRFLNAIMSASRKAGKAVGADNIGKAIREGLEGTHSAFAEYEVQLAEAEQAMVNFALNSKGRFGELDPVVQDLINQLMEGRGTAESAAAAIDEIGKAGDFGGLIDGLKGIVRKLFEVRNAANAARSAAQFSDLGKFPSRDEFNTTLGITAPAKPKPAPVSLADYPIIASAGSGGGGGGTSAAANFDADLERERQRLANLQEETSLISTLSPLIDDYGYAIEKLRMQQDLENEATRAGLDLTPDRVNAINELAEGYATATVEAGRLAEAQQSARDTMEDWFSSGRDIARGFIDDLGDAKSAADALGNAFQAIGSKLLDLGLAGLFGTGSGSNPFGAIGKLFGFATGTANTGGRRGEPRGVVHGQEAVIPLPAGGKVPVDLRLPSLPSSTAGGAPQFTFAPVIDARGADTAAVEKLGQILARERAEFEPRVRQIVANRGKNLW